MDYIESIIKNSGYREQLINFILRLKAVAPNRRDFSWCYVSKALEQHYSEADIIKLALKAPHCAGLFCPGIHPEPTLEELISRGEELYRRHCNADGAFRFEDFDTPEKLDAFYRERKALAAADYIDDIDEDDEADPDEDEAATDEDEAATDEDEAATDE